MASNHFKKELLHQFAIVAKALGHGHRLALLELLSQGERTVESLAAASGLTIANTSRHLQQLRQAGLVEADRHGQHVFYRLRGEEVIELFQALQKVARKRLAEVDRLIATFLEARDSLEPVTAEDLLVRLREGRVTVLDVRPPEEFAAGHIKNAINIPLDALEQALDTLPREQEIVAYCRGPYCILAYEAVASLRRHGFRARRLEYGLPEWRAHGHPVSDARANIS